MMVLSPAVNARQLISTKLTLKILRSTNLGCKDERFEATNFKEAWGFSGVGGSLVEQHRASLLGGCDSGGC